MARGRKKGGLKINELSDRNEIIKMVTNQINSLNKKIKAFKNEGVEEHLSFIKDVISSDMGQFTSNDTLSKSKSFYNSKSDIWLKKTLSALHKLNNHVFYGTVNKYQKEVSTSLKKVQKYSADYLEKRGYSQQFIDEVTSSKDFLARLLNSFNDKDNKYGSDQNIEKIALNYDSEEMPAKERDKILSNLEYSQNVQDRIREENEAFTLFKQSRLGKKR